MHPGLSRSSCHHPGFLQLFDGLWTPPGVEHDGRTSKATVARHRISAAPRCAVDAHRACPRLRPHWISPADARDSRSSRPRRRHRRRVRRRERTGVPTHGDDARRSLVSRRTPGRGSVERRCYVPPHVGRPAIRTSIDHVAALLRSARSNGAHHRRHPPRTPRRRRARVYPLRCVWHGGHPPERVRGVPGGWRERRAVPPDSPLQASPGAEPLARARHCHRWPHWMDWRVRHRR